MKKILALVVILAALAAAAYFTLQNPLGRLVKLAIEEFVPQLTQTSVRISKVEISAADGRGTISGLVLGNPQGFKLDYALQAGTIDIALEPASVVKDVVVVHKVFIDAPLIGYEKAGGITNFDAIQRNIEKYLGTDHGKSDQAGQEAGKKMIIGSFIIRNARVNYNDMLELKLPDIELRNIGKKSGGATSAQVVKAVIKELNTQLAIALAKAAVIGGVGGVVLGAGAAIKSLLGD